MTNKYEASQNHVETINAMIKKYTTSFSKHSPNALMHSQNGEVVVLTGSTGPLSSSIHDPPIHDERLRKVYCFNRPAIVSITQRQESSFVTLKVDLTLLSDIVNIGRLVHCDWAPE